jgi:hypothetical protein
MSYDPNNLSALIYANGFTLWHYKTRDTQPEIFKPGYFNEASRMLRVGDGILINANIETALVSLQDGSGVMAMYLDPTYAGPDVEDTSSIDPRLSSVLAAQSELSAMYKRLDEIRKDLESTGVSVDDDAFNGALDAISDCKGSLPDETRIESA